MAPLDVGPPDPWFSGGGGGGGGTLPSAIGPGAPPPSASGLGGGGWNWTPPPITDINTILNSTQTHAPDYAALMDQYIGPYQSIADQQLAAMQEAQDKQAGFAREAYGINSDSYKEAHTDALRNIVNSLAARGMLQSGDRGWLRAKENRRYQRQSGLAANSLAAYLAGLASSMQQARFSSQAGLAQQRLGLSQWLPQAFPTTVTHPFSFSW